jgi:hypothetical protein
MGGQRRAFARSTIAAACLLAVGGLSGCSAGSGAAPEALCSLPITGTLERSIDGGYLYTYENGSTARIAFANGSCVLDANPFPIPREINRTEWELGYTYDYYLAQLRPCLNGFGFPAVAPPERADFIESDGDWSPYDAVYTTMVSGSKIAQLNSVCPRQPPALR